MNILITKNKNIQFFFKLYYFIFLLIVLSVLTSLIFTNSFYQKSSISKNPFVDGNKEDLSTLYKIHLRRDPCSKIRYLMIFRLIL